jgi:hypothetical protein
MMASNKVPDTEAVFVEISLTLQMGLDCLRNPSWTGGTGWVCQPGALRSLKPGEPWPEGEILSAERVLDEMEGRSLHIRTAREGWHFTILKERKEQERIELPEFLASSILYLASFPDLGRLHYRRYFRLTEQDGLRVYRPWAARFAGFSPKEQP